MVLALVWNILSKVEQINQHLFLSKIDNWLAKQDIRSGILFWSEFFMYVHVALNKHFSFLNKQRLLQSLRGLYDLEEGWSKRKLSGFQLHCKVTSVYEQTLSMTLDFPLSCVPAA